MDHDEEQPAPASPGLATTTATTDEKTPHSSTETKHAASPPGRRASSFAREADAAGEGPNYKDQVQLSCRQASLSPPLNYDKKGEVPQHLPNFKEQVYSRIHANRTEERIATRGTPTPTTNSTSQRGRSDPSSLLLQANHVVVTETDEERRRRILNEEALATAEVVDDDNPLQRRRAWWPLLLLLLLVVLMGIVVGVTVGRGSTVDPQPDQVVSPAGQEATIAPSRPTPTAAPTVRAPAQVTLQIVVGMSGDRNGEHVMDLYDGALVDVDEAGTQYFAVIADTSPNVRSVVFDNGEVENNPPFSRCGSTNAFGFLRCLDLDESGIHSIGAVPYPDRQQEGVPWPAVNVTFEVIGRLG